MAGLNEGDVMEGIFSIGIAEMFANGKATKSFINSTRAKIDTKMFQTGTFNYVTYAGPQQLKGYKADHLTVNLNMRLKHGSTQWAYGEEWSIQYEKSGEIGNLDSKIGQIVNIINGPNYMRMISKAKDTWLKNNKVDDVIVDITCDGIAGEQSGGNVKGDVMVEAVMRDANSNGKKGDTVLKQEMVFSIKSGSNTVANLSPFYGCIDVLNRFNVTLPRQAKYERFLGEVLRTARSNAQKRAKVKAIRMFYNETMEEVKKASTRLDFKRRAFDIFRSATFGTDLAQVVDVDKAKTKEMNPEYLQEVFDSSNDKMNVESGGGTSGTPSLKFKIRGNADSPLYNHINNKVLFSFSFKKRVVNDNDDIKIKELKFYINSGPAAYLPKGWETKEQT